MVNINEIPLMFQAQISGRGQVQYIGDTTNIKRWVNEWMDGAKNQSPAVLSKSDSKVFQKKKYKITWRMLSNSGQDADIIRPIIAAGGFPYYPGASMKGAFLRQCTPEQAERYCGRKTSDNFDVAAAIQRVVDTLNLIEIFFKEKNYLLGITLLVAAQESFLKAAIVNEINNKKINIKNLNYHKNIEDNKIIIWKKSGLHFIHNNQLKSNLNIMYKQNESDKKNKQ